MRNWKPSAKLQAQIEFVIDTLGTIGQDAAKSKLQQLESNLTAVIARIDQAKASTPTDRRTADDVADELIAKLADLGRTIKKLPPPTLRPLLQALISKLEVDMETKAIHLELGMPDWSKQNGLCLEDKSVQRLVYQAQYEIPLETADCSYRRTGRNPCYECTRRAA